MEEKCVRCGKSLKYSWEKIDGLCHQCFMEKYGKLVNDDDDI